MARPLRWVVMVATSTSRQLKRLLSWLLAMELRRWALKENFSGRSASPLSWASSWLKIVKCIGKCKLLACACRNSLPKQLPACLHFPEDLPAMLMGMVSSWCPWQHTALWAPNHSDTKAIHNAQAGGIPLPVNLLLAQVRGHPATDLQVTRRASPPNIAAAASRHKRSSCYRCWWARMPSWPRLQCPPSSGAGSCMVSNQPPAQQGWHLPCVGAHSGRC